MDQSIAAADRLLGVLTDTYVEALFSSSERWAAYWDDPQGRKGFLVPVEVKEVSNWPPLTRSLKRLSLVGLSEAEAERNLLDFWAVCNMPAGSCKFLPEATSLPGGGALSDSCLPARTADLIIELKVDPRAKSD